MFSKELLEFAETERNRLLDYYKSVGLHLDPYKEILAFTTKISEEVGELSSEVLGSLSLQRQSKLEQRQPSDLPDEMADVILSTLILANSMSVNISQALERKIKKIRNRN